MDSGTINLPGPQEYLVLAPSATSWPCSWTLTPPSHSEPRGHHSDLSHRESFLGWAPAKALARRSGWMQAMECFLNTQTHCVLDYSSQTQESRAGNFTIGPPGTKWHVPGLFVQCFWTWCTTVKMFLKANTQNSTIYSCFSPFFMNKYCLELETSTIKPNLSPVFSVNIYRVAVVGQKLYRVTHRITSFYPDVIPVKSAWLFYPHFIDEETEAQKIKHTVHCWPRLGFPEWQRLVRRALQSQSLILTADK